MWVDTTCSSHKTKIPVAGWCGVMGEAGQTSWDAQLGPCSAQCQPRMVTVPVVAHPQQGCVVGAATQSQPRALGHAEQTNPAKSFISEGKFPSTPLPEQFLGL